MKPSIPKGTRDFLPAQVIKRNFIFETIRKVFVKYGYQPIETPVMESLSTLTGKYGEEGDKLLFKVLNNGNFLAKADKEALADLDSNKLVSSISKRGLRYDLTVPFARYVVMHQNDIAFPFKRYAIEPVWRADRPQKGRYQEFYQCDVDVVGSDSLMYEAELVQIYDEVFANFNMKVIIKINNRKILAGMAEVAGCADKFMDMTVAIDKLDKIGIEKVCEEMSGRDISDSAIKTIRKVLEVKELSELKTLFRESETGMKGIEELETTFSYLSSSTQTNKVEFDITLARGLSYYTGCIFEVAHDAAAYPEVKMGSVGGGGRYADLTGVFGMKDMSGVGVSFGAERIYDVMEELDLFPESNPENLQVLFIAFDEKSHQYAFQQLTKLRQAGINADLYPKPTKLKKQMKYANDRQVPFVALVGDKEMETGMLAFKNMESGEQESLTVGEVIGKFGNNSSRRNLTTKLIEYEFDITGLISEKSSKKIIKNAFNANLKTFANSLKEFISTKNSEWTVRGFIDVFQNVFSISSDTKVVSKILEIQLFSKFLEFGKDNGLDLVLAEHQNWYPDISFVSKLNPEIRFAVDLKSTYFNSESKKTCNGFTLGSHGTYFIDRKSSKNIQFPYGSYLGHFCIGVIYARNPISIDETKAYSLNELESIPSVMNNVLFFACEKWKLASDKRGSGNTANIGSTKKVEEILKEKGRFAKLGEKWFDDYWKNYGKITVEDEKGNSKKITSLDDFLTYRGKK